MNKFLSSFSSGISEDRVREIIEDTSVIYNDDSSVSINNSANASIYTLPTVGGVAGNSVVVGADGKTLIFANTSGSGVTNPLTDVLDANGNSIVNIHRLQGEDMKDLKIDSNVDMLNYSMKKLASISGSGGKLDILNTNLHMNSGTIYNASAVVGAGLNNDLLLSGAITLNGDINMANFTLNNVRNVSKSSINLSLIPATAGSPGQVLTRASNFDIKDPLTAQLVWTTPTGGVTNPLSGILDCNGFGLYNVSSITSQNSGSFNISINGSLLFIQNIPVLSSPNGLRIRVAEIFNTGLVTSFLDDCVFSKVVLFANGIETNTIKQRTGTALALTSPTINISGSTAINLTGPTNIIGNAIFQQTVRTNTLDTYTGGTVSCLQNLTLAATKRLNAPSVYTNNIRPYENSELVITGLQSDNKTLSNITISAPVITINNIFDTLNPGTAVNIDGTLNFSNANKINNVNGLTGYSGGVPLNLDLIPSTEGLPSQALIRDPAYNPANPSTHKLKWASVLTNPLTVNLDCATQWIDNVGRLTVSEIYSPYPDVQLHANLTLYGSINMSDTIANLKSIVSDAVNASILIRSPTLNIVSTTTTTIAGTTANLNFNNVNISNNLNVLTNRSPSIGVRTTLFKTFGAMPSVDLNTLTPVKVNTTIANQKGTNLIPANGFVNGDKFIITMYGLLTTLGSGSLNISLYVGASLALNFNVINVGITNQGAKFTFEIDCTTAGSNVNLGNSTAFLSVERFNTSIRFATPVQTNLINNQLTNNTFDIHMYQTSAQVSSFTPLSYTIEQM